MISYYHGPPKPTCLEVFMVHNLVFRWPKPLFFMVLAAHGIYIYIYPLKGVMTVHDSKEKDQRRG